MPAAADVVLRQGQRRLLDESRDPLDVRRIVVVQLHRTATLAFEIAEAGFRTRGRDPERDELARRSRNQAQP